MPGNGQDGMGRREEVGDRGDDKAAGLTEVYRLSIYFHE